MVDDKVIEFVDKNKCHKCGKTTYLGDYCFNCHDLFKHGRIVDDEKLDKLKPLTKFKEDE